MIQANELRIGNWVYPNEENATPWPIVGILNDEKVYFGLSSFNGRQEELTSVIEPIPLTPEILLACGFVKTMTGNYMIMDEDFWIDENKDGFTCKRQISANVPNWMPIADIKYLHQLQNLYYALTQTELTFNPSNV